MVAEPAELIDEIVLPVKAVVANQRVANPESPSPNTPFPLTWKPTRLSPAATFRATSAGAGRSRIAIWPVEVAAARPMLGSNAPTLIRSGLMAVYVIEAS